MVITLSPSAEMILSRNTDFRDKLLAALKGSLEGQCFIDGRVGRTPANDELIFMCQDHETIGVESYEFADPATIKEIIRKWSST